jgi:hypothetical protein
MEPFKNQLHVVSGLEASRPATAAAAITCVRRGASERIAGAQCRSDSLSPRRLWIRSSLRRSVRIRSLPSLELGIEDTSYTRRLRRRYACSYMNTVSWRLRRNRFRWNETRWPFSNVCSATAARPEQRLARRKEDRSILDSVTGDVARIGKNIGPSDRAARRVSG